MFRTGTTSAARDASSLRGLAAACGAGVLLLTGCTADASDAAMTLTVSAVTDEPVTVWFDTRQRSESGLTGEGVDSTPVELSPQRPSVALPVPYERGNWLWARVAGPHDGPPGTVVGCELRTANGRVISADVSDPLRPSSDEAACAGAG